MEAFHGVFTKRGDLETLASPEAGAFDEVFVRRGRWRKNSTDASHQSPADVLNLAEHAATGLGVEYPVPSLSDISPQFQKATAPFSENLLKQPCATQLDVKNTFINAALSDFDSLQDFLKERQVKSCPASRQASSVTMFMDDIQAGLRMKEEMLNTASSFGDATFRVASCKDADGCFDDSTSMPSGTSDSVLNTATTFSDSDFDWLQQRISEVTHQPEDVEVPALELSRFLEAAPGDLKLDNVAAQDKVGSLRFMGAHGPPGLTESNLAPAISAGVALGQPSSNQWLVSVQTEQGVMPGIVTLLGEEPPTFSPSEPPLIDANFMSAMAMPPPPPAAPPSAAPVLRLAEAIAPPELGGPELPSIGSLLHHRGECKPCTFFHTRGCENKEDCKFCHLCGPGEKKKRIKKMKAAQREVTLAALENAKAALASYHVAEQLGFQIESIIE